MLSLSPSYQLVEVVSDSLGWELALLLTSRGWHGDGSGVEIGLRESWLECGLIEAVEWKTAKEGEGEGWRRGENEGGDWEG